MEVIEKEEKLTEKMKNYDYALEYSGASNQTVVHRKGKVYGHLDKDQKVVRNELKGKLQDDKSIIKKFDIVKTSNAEYPFNVRILTSVDCGRTFFYSGNGKFCKTEEEAEKYKSYLEGLEETKNLKKNFIDDENKVNAMIELSKKGFLMSYGDVTELEYENTKEQILHFVRTKKQLYKELNQNINKEKLE